MKLLFFSHYFPPEVNAPATRTVEHCREWVRHGHEVTVVTCAPNHPRGILYEGYKNRMFQSDQVDGIRVIRLWTFLSPNEGVLRRTLNYVSYMMSAIVATPWLPKADVVISTSPQFFAGLAGYFVSRFKGAPWVLEIRDLWPESIEAVGAVHNKGILRILEWLEMFAYRKADRIVPVTDSFKTYVMEKGIADEKIFVIKNGVDLSMYRHGVDSKAVEEKLRLEGKFVASYVGTHGMAHNLETILETAAMVKEQDIVFLLVGDGAERETLVRKRDELGLQNVVMLKQLPKELMPALWSLTDVSIVLLKKSRLFRTVIPSKIFESMAMEVPIVLGVEGEAKRIIDDAGAGICIEPESSEELKAAILKLFEQKDLRTQLGANGRRFVTEYFDRTVLAKRYESVLAGTLRDPSPSTTAPARDEVRSNHE